MCLTDSLDIMCSKSDWLELLSPLVHVIVVSLREAVARKAQGRHQAILAFAIADNNCLKVPPGRWTSIVHCDLSKGFISPEKSSSLSRACESDFL